MVLDFVTPTPLGTRWGKIFKIFWKCFYRSKPFFATVEMTPRTQFKRKKLKTKLKT